MEADIVSNIVTKVIKSKLVMKMKPKQWLISLIIVLFYFGSGFFAAKVNFFEYNKTLAGTKIEIENNTTTKCENQIIWWQFEDEGLKLNYNSQLVNQDKLVILGKKNDEQVIPVSETLSTDFNGSFMAVAKLIMIDMNGDGNNDEVYISAKGDTIATRGFTAVNTFFNDQMIPFEVVIEGDNDLKIYFDQKLLKGGVVKVTAVDGLERKFRTNSETGIIHLDNMNTLRKNVNITYINNNKYYIASYVVEGHRLFSKEHLQGLKNLSILLAISALLIIGIMNINRFKYTNQWRQSNG